MRSLPTPIRLLLLALVVLAALFPLYGPLIAGDSYDFYLQKVTGILILCILAVSLDLLVGVTGMVSVAHAAFLGIAGYTLALYGPEYEAANILTALPVSLAAAAVASLVIGVLIIRTGGIFFIMATIAFSQMIYYLFHDADFSGGSDGIYIMVRPALMIGDTLVFTFDDPHTLFYVTLGSLVGVYLLLRAMLRAPFGRVLAGIKENENRVQALGYNPVLYKLAAFVIAGTLAGYAGFLTASQYGYMNPAQLSWTMSAHALIMVIMGGLGTLFGPILGAFALEGLHHLFASWTSHWELLLGLVAVGIVLFMPGGIAGLLLRLCERHREPTAPEAEAVVAEPPAPRPTVARPQVGGGPLKMLAHKEKS